MDDYRTRGGSSRREDYGEEYEERDSRERGGGNIANIQRMDSIQDPGKRFVLKDCIGSGVYGDVFEAIDENDGK